MLSDPLLELLAAQTVQILPQRYTMMDHFHTCRPFCSDVTTLRAGMEWKQMNAGVG